jgi:hypothetical protein
MNSKDMPIDRIQEIYRKYSIMDIAETLFASSLWLPNIASPVKHLFATSVFVTLSPNEFSHVKKIKSYSDFKKLLANIFSVIPDFSYMEDYVPELDWGEVKFHHNGHNCKIMYGGEIEHTYDFLEVFQTFYGSIREEFVQVTGRDPFRELENTLQIQADIIEGIGGQPKSRDIQKRIKPGNFEIPTESFWNCAKDFFQKYTMNECFEQNFLNQYSIQLGEMKKEILTDQFGDLVFSGKLLNYFFLKNGTEYLPILPRRYNTILLDSLAKILSEKYDAILPSYTEYLRKFGYSLHRYIESRVRCPSLFPFVSAVNKEGRPDDTVFSSAFISKNKLFLIYLLKPPKRNSELTDNLKMIKDKLKIAKNLISSLPVTIGLHTERKNAVFETRKDGLNLAPHILVIIPMLTPAVEIFGIPESFPANIVFLDQFLGIVDDLENIDQIASFYDYLEEYSSQIRPINDLLDLFASFKLSKGVLVGGAVMPNLILLDPHFGSNERFNSLAIFWKKYPDTNLFGHPREWQVEQETPTRTRLVSKSKFESIISCQIGLTHIFMTSPFSEQKREQVEISNLLMECLEDSLNVRKRYIKAHQFFKNFNQILIIFVPCSLVRENEKFNHLRHIDLSSKWFSDTGFFRSELPGIRVIYDEKKVFEALRQTEDRSEEVNLLLEILSNMNHFSPDKNFAKIVTNLLNTVTLKPRIKMHWISREVSFPEAVRYQEPRDTHYKLARKKIATIAREINLKPGYYKSTKAKMKINEMRKKVVHEIDSIVNKYNFTFKIPFLITQIDSLTHTFERTRLRIELSQDHQVEYSRQEEFATKHSNYIRLHRNNRYLIEKFVQLSPKGRSSLEMDQYHYLIALIDWLHVLYQASDSLHYGIFPLGLNVSDGYLFKVVYSRNNKKTEDLFFKEQAELLLGIKGIDSDKLESPYFLEFLENLDNAFKQDFGFSFRRMITVLQLLSLWSDYNNTEAQTYYSAGMPEIVEMCNKHIGKIESEELEKILSFLTLKPMDMLRILGQGKPCNDLPVWEHNKRYSRYTLKPLIVIGDLYYWGPYSVMKTGKLWTNQLSQTLLPYDLQGKNIQKVIENERKILERELENKALLIVQRFTKYAKRNVELHKIDKNGNHPPNLGDFDVLSYHPDKGIILNIECKHIPPVYCPKDLHRLRKKILRSYLPKHARRQQYLVRNCGRIMKIMDWPNEKNKLPKVLAIFLTQQSYWFTRLSHDKIEPKYVQIDLLADFISNLP